MRLAPLRGSRTSGRGLRWPTTGYRQDAAAPISLICRLAPPRHPVFSLPSQSVKNPLTRPKWIVRRAPTLYRHDTDAVPMCRFTLQNMIRHNCRSPKIPLARISNLCHMAAAYVIFFDHCLVYTASVFRSQTDHAEPSHLRGWQ